MIKLGSFKDMKARRKSVVADQVKEGAKALMRRAADRDVGTNGLTALRAALLFAAAESIPFSQVVPFFDLDKVNELKIKMDLIDDSSHHDSRSEARRPGSATAHSPDSSSEKKDFSPGQAIGNHEDRSKDWEHRLEAVKRDPTTFNDTENKFSTITLLQTIVQLRSLNFNATVEQFNDILEAWPEAVHIRFGPKSQTNLLHLACVCNVPAAIVEKLVEADPSMIVQRDCYGATPLAWAVLHNTEPDNIKLLLNRGFDEAVCTIQDNHYGYTALQMALDRHSDDAKYYGVIRRLAELDNGRATSIPSRGGNMLPLHLAAMRGGPEELLRMLIDLYPGALLQKDEMGRLPLHLALMRRGRRKLEVYQLLVSDQTCTLCVQEESGGMTPFHLAASRRLPEEVLELLLDEHVSRLANAADQLPLHVILGNSIASMNLVEELLSYNGDATSHQDSSGRTPLALATMNRSDFDLVKVLVEHDEKSSSLLDNSGRSPLVHALEKYDSTDRSFSEVVELLVKADDGGALRARTKDLARSPLHVAAFKNRPFEIMKLLVDSLVECTVQRDSDGFTPLHLAVQSPGLTSLDTYKLLCENKSALAAQDDLKKRTPFHAAVEHKVRVEVLKLLVDESMGLLQDTKGRCPLHLAAAENELDVVRELLQISPKATSLLDHDGRNPLMGATIGKACYEVVELLLEANEASASETDCYDDTALHMTLQSYSNDDRSFVRIVEALVGADGGKCLTLGTKRGNQMIPLLVACQFGSSYEAIKLIVEGNPDTLLVPDVYGLLPIHHALLNKCNDTLETYGLLSSNKGCLRMQEKDKLRTPFHVGVDEGHPFAVLELLLDKSMSVVQDREGRCALHAMASRAGWNEEELEVVFDLNKDVAKIKTMHQQYPLHIVAEHHIGCDGLLKRLMEENSEAVRSVDEGLRTPLHLASMKETSKASIEILFSAFKGAASLQDKKLKTPLHILASNPEGMDDLESILLEFESVQGRLGSDGISMSDGGWTEFCKAADVRDCDERTPLHWAVERDGAKDSLLKSLMSVAKSALSTLDSDEKTPLHLMAGCGLSLGVVKTAIVAHREACGVTDSLGRTPLHWAAYRGVDEDVIDLLFRSWRAAAHERDDCGDYPLHLLAKGDVSFGLFKSVLDEYEVAGWMCGGGGRTPLHWLSSVGRCPDAVMLLLSMFGEMMVMKSDDDGATPIHLAAEKGVSKEFLQLLLCAKTIGSLPTDSKGRTPLHSAAIEGGSVDNIDSLLKFSRERNHDLLSCRDVDGNTPLHLAVGNGASLEVVELLVREGVGAVSARNDQGRTPLHVGVAVGGDEDILHLLLKCKNTVNISDYNEETVLSTALTTGKIYSYQLMKAIFERYPKAARLDTVRGPSPIRYLILLMKDREDVTDEEFAYFARLMRLFVRGNVFREPKRLQPLCVMNDALRLEFFFCIFDCRDEEETGAEEFRIPTIDLNDENIIFGWSLLGIIADIDTVQSTQVFFSLMEQIRLRKKRIELRCTDGNMVIFRPLAYFREGTMRRAANRAQLAKTTDLRSWAQSYGRFLGKYRLNPDDIKSKSAKSMIVYGTETDVHGNDEKVAVKLLSDDAFFVSEIEVREKFVKDVEENFVIGIKRAYTVTSRVDLGYGSALIKYDQQDVWRHLERYPKMRLAPVRNNPPDPIAHVLVMSCGTGLTLNDFIVHQDPSNRVEQAVIETARSIAECIQYLNDECGILHANIRPRNFMFMPTGKYNAIGLTRSVVINGINTVGEEGLVSDDGDENRRRYSGYLPPEHAARAYFLRTKGRGTKKNEVRSMEQKYYEEKFQALMDADLDGGDSSALWDEFRRARQRLLQARKNADIGPPTVVATRQYDMWCYGVMLYYIATGMPHIPMDAQQEIGEKEVETLIGWDQAKLNECLGNIPDGWDNLKLLLGQLMQPNPLRRPHSWSDILRSLDGETTADDVRLMFRSLEGKISGVCVGCHKSTGRRIEGS